MQKNVLQIFFYHQSIDVEEINVLDQFLWYFCLDKNIVSKKFGRKKTFISILSSWQYAAKLIFFQIWFNHTFECEYGSHTSIYHQLKDDFTLF